MASSIHTIYRPVARSRKMSLTSRSRPRLHVSTLSPTEYSSDEIVQSDEEPDADDFEETTPKAPDPAAPSHLQLRSVSYVTQRQLGSSKLPEVVAMSRSGRSGSMATVRLQRRTKLAEKLRDIFELDGIEEVQAGTFGILFGNPPHTDALPQNCRVGFYDLFVSHSTLSTYQSSFYIIIPSITGIYVSHEQLPMLLRAYAFPRGSSSLSFR